MQEVVEYGVFGVPIWIILLLILVTFILVYYASSSSRARFGVSGSNVGHMKTLSVSFVVLIFGSVIGLMMIGLYVAPEAPLTGWDAFIYVLPNIIFGLLLSIGFGFLAFYTKYRRSR